MESGSRASKRLYWIKRNLEKFFKNKKGAKMDRDNKKKECTLDIWAVLAISIVLVALGGAHIAYCVCYAKWIHLFGPLFYAGLSTRNIFRCTKLCEQNGYLKALEDMISHWGK